VRFSEFSKRVCWRDLAGWQSHRLLRQCVPSSVECAKAKLTVSVETCFWTANCLTVRQTKTFSYTERFLTVEFSVRKALIVPTQWLPRLHNKSVSSPTVVCKRNALPNSGLLHSGVTHRALFLLDVLNNPVAFCSPFTKSSTKRKGNTLKGRSVCVESVFSTHKGLEVVQTTTKLTKRTRIRKRSNLTAFKKLYFCSYLSCSKRGLDHQECSKVKTDLRNGFFRHFYANLCLVFIFWWIFLVETPIGKKNAVESVDILGLHHTLEWAAL